MKKTFIVLIFLFSVLSTGCTSNKINKCDSLKDAYINLGYQIENNSEITKEYIESLLNGYSYTKGDLVEGQFQQHIFTHDKEKLTIVNSHTDENIFIDIIYNYTDDNSNLLLTYMDSSHSNKLFTSISVNDVSVYESISKITDTSNSKLLEFYNKYSKDLSSSTNISINDIEQSLNLKPSHQISKYPNTALDVIYYSFVDKDEELAAYYTKENNKLIHLSYTSKGSLYLKDTLSHEYNNKFITSLSTYVDTFSIHDQILNILIK